MQIIINIIKYQQLFIKVYFISKKLKSDIFEKLII